MRESTVYQDIRERGRVEGHVTGRAEGRVEGLVIGELRGERAVIVRIGTRRFGPPTPAVLARLNGVDDLAELNRLTDRVIDVQNWAELLGQ